MGVKSEHEIAVHGWSAGRRARWLLLLLLLLLRPSAPLSARYVYDPGTCLLVFFVRHEPRVFGFLQLEEAEGCETAAADAVAPLALMASYVGGGSSSGSCPAWPADSTISC